MSRIVFDGICRDLTNEGKGIVDYRGNTVFVPNLLVGEKASIEIYKRVSNIFYGKVIKLIEKSKDRVNPPCSYYKDCGGCNLQHMNYLSQLTFKKQQVINAYKKVAKLNVDVLDTIGMDVPYAYRNKVQLPVSSDKKKTILGFYKENTHDVVSIDKCLLQDDISNDIVIRIRKMLNELHIEAYNEDTRKGYIRHILIKRGFVSGETVLVLVTNTDSFPARGQLVDKIKKEMPFINTIVQNINSRKTSVILSSKEKVLYGKGYIIDELLGLKFKISAQSFYQINHEQTEKLYTKAIEMAKLKKSDVVLDAYCGVGTIGMSLAKYVKEVIGVEIVEDAIKDAKENAKLNNLKNVKYYCDDAGDFMRKMVKDKVVVDVVFVDPPRAGCDKKFLDSLVYLKPKKIVYISCNVATQARDVRILVDKGYKYSSIQPVDMFPNTFHVESICCLTLK